jgi:hypothetical protein
MNTTEDVYLIVEGLTLHMIESMMFAADLEQLSYLKQNMMAADS